MVEYRRASKPAQRRTGSSGEPAVRLGEAVAEVMARRIGPQQRKFGPVAQMWEELLPEQLRGHCRISDVTGGQLQVVVDSPAYLYEMRLCCKELLEQLNAQCPRAPITAIKPVVG